MTPKSPRKEPISDLLSKIHWPPIAGGKKWKKNSSTFNRLCHYGKKLRELGMNDDQIACMLSDLCWDFLSEFQPPSVIPDTLEADIPKLPHFDEYQIAFRVDVADVTMDELKRNYKFHGNGFASGKNIWISLGGSNAGGGPLHNFLGNLRLDNNYAFGPTKSQRGLTTAKLVELGAVGVYKRKDPKG